MVAFMSTTQSRRQSRVITQAITPLRMIFWGGLLCLFDLSFTQTSNGTGFKFDILNDAVGVVMITVGVFRLSSLPVHAKFETAMSFVKVVAVLSILDAICDHVITPLPAPVQLILQLFGIATLAAMITFCVAMRWLSNVARLPHSEASWRTTTNLFVFIYAIPLGLIHLLGMAAIASGTSFNLNVGPLGLLLLPIFAIPIIHLFVSTSRMQREAE